MNPVNPVDSVEPADRNVPAAAAAAVDLAAADLAVAGLAAERPGGVESAGRFAVAALVALLSALVTVLGVVFLPLRWGGFPLPVSVLIVAGALVGLPRAGYRMTGSVVVAAIPAAVWFAITVVLTVHRNALYPGLAVVILDWRMLLLLGLGAAASALTLGPLANAPRHRPTRPAPTPGPD